METNPFPKQEEFHQGGCSIHELISRIQDKARWIHCSGMQESGLPFLLARIAEIVQKKPLLLITSDSDKAFHYYENMAFYAQRESQVAHKALHFYPSDDLLPYSEMLPDRNAMQKRLGVLLQLQQGDTPILVVPIQALLRKVLPRTTLTHHSDILLKGEEINRAHLLTQLVENGYQRVDTVEDRGTFCVHGGVLDVYSPLYELPVRVELDDLEVESLRFFDPDTQRTVREIEELIIGPVDDILHNPQQMLVARKRIGDVAAELQFSTLSFNQLLQDLESGIRPFGLQALSPGFYDGMESLLDYLPSDSVLLLDDPHELRFVANEYWESMENSYQLAISENRLAFAPHEFLLSWEECQQKITPFIRIEGHFAHPPEVLQQSDIGLPQKPFINHKGQLMFAFSMDNHNTLKNTLSKMSAQAENRLQPLIENIHYWKEQRCRVLLISGSKGQGIRLKEILEHYQVRAHLYEQEFSLQVLKENKRDLPEVEIYMGRLLEGFVYPRDHLVLLSEEEIFGNKSKRKKSKSRKTVFASELQSLKQGDFVIHKKHGFAQYGGLHTIEIDDRKGDFLLLHFQGADKLYLPVDRVNMIERYLGGKPNLDKLQGTSFEKKKTKARKAIFEMSGELLKLYAAREAQKGHAFEKPSEAYAEFEARFPFEETADQIHSINEVLKDMQSEKCMDRLICGDVGFGKTEIAMRAAFVSAYQGRQVSVLVPTTVLAQQHGLRFAERFDGTPLRIEVLSRFQNKAEQKNILKDLEEGKIDIIIGTHRLLSKDVHFKKLGLLIVDEEQRFGVKAKEQIKKIKEQLVDVLTLSATPIPRTLEMSIMGIRDLTLIQTPPHDRLAIRTIVAPFSEQVIRESILKELARGGQVFFLHNRVENIGSMKETIQKILPEARIGIAHGQMEEGALERAMLDFVQGVHNILLCTTIIESGLDIPRANTIIVNRSDTFGLSQLYQIRGRVGRSKERAFAYLLVPDEKNITNEAKERLKTLQKFTELGAGFHIARQDLEMRGAGNLLGKQQSGHIHEIGMDLYFEMLQETMNELLGREPKLHIDPEVHLGMEAYIPETYIPDIHLRLQCYQRISFVDSIAEVDEIAMEFWDRFGAPPPEVETLLACTEVKLLVANIWGINAEIRGNRFQIHLHKEAPLLFEKLMNDISAQKSICHLLPNNGLGMNKELPAEGRLKEIRTFIRALEPYLEKTLLES